MEPPTTSSGPERALAAIGYLGPLVVVPLLRRRKPRFLSYHTRQALYLFVVFLAAFILTFIPVLLMRNTSLESSVFFIVFSVLLLLELTVYGLASLVLLVQTARGRMPMVPVLGEMAGEG